MHTQGTEVAGLRWHLHELDPAWAAPANFDRVSAFTGIKFHLDDFSGIVADLAQRLLTHLHRLSEEIDELTAELSRRIPVIAPTLLAIVGCGSLTAEKILGETAGVSRFRSKDAYARHNGTAPLPVSAYGVVARCLLSITLVPVRRSQSAPSSNPRLWWGIAVKASDDSTTPMPAGVSAA
jgi:transposase